MSALDELGASVILNNRGFVGCIFVRAEKAATVKFGVD